MNKNNLSSLVKLVFIIKMSYNPSLLTLPFTVNKNSNLSTIKRHKHYNNYVFYCHPNTLCICSCHEISICRHNAVEFYDVIS